MTIRNTLPRGSTKTILENYNHQFENHESLKLTYNVASKRFPTINRLFNQRWHPTEAREQFLDTFSATAWNQLSESEQQQHSAFTCKACADHPLTLTLPKSSTKAKKKPTISFTKTELSSPSEFGRKALKELNAISKQTFNKSIQDVITETPRSKLVHKPNSTERKKQRQEMEKQIRVTI